MCLFNGHSMVETNIAHFLVLVSFMNTLDLIADSWVLQGRIGRIVLRNALLDKRVEVVAVNE